MLAMQVALVGNPNAGKTTLFNALTGLHAQVGNYPGVTVDIKQGTFTLPNQETAQLIDLPGCYSLNARLREEALVSQVLLGSQTTAAVAPDVVLCVIDATTLARGLYLVLELMELQLPMVLALNMTDMLEATHTTIDVALLQQRLGLPVVSICARQAQGLNELREALLMAKNKPYAPIPLAFNKPEQQAISALQNALNSTKATPGMCLWLLTSQIKPQDMNLSAQAITVLQAQQQALDPQALGLCRRRIITLRYAAVDTVLEGVWQRTAAKPSSLAHRLDQLLLHPFWGLIIFACIMFGLFQAVFAWSTPVMSSIETYFGMLSFQIAHLMPPGYSQSLLLHGIAVGVGNVLLFVPQIAALFTGLALLEDSGYMARAAWLLDSLMRRVGLHGKAFVPLMSSFACAVPGIMAARTIESPRDRLVTIFIAPFMSCSARLPVYTLIIGAILAPLPPLWGFISWGGLIVCCMYLLGFVAAIGTAWLLKRTVLKTPPTPLLLELPTYRWPQPSSVLRVVVERCRVFVSQTGTTMVSLSILLWALLTFPQVNMLNDKHAAPQDVRAYRLEHSFAGQLGHAIEPLIQPLGFDWRIGIALIASFAAREVLVSTLGEIYALDTAGQTTEQLPLASILKSYVDPITQKPTFTPLIGTSLMVFFVLALQCLSTVATVRRETNSRLWPLLQLAYMNGLAWCASFLVYQGGRWLGLE